MVLEVIVVPDLGGVDRVEVFSGLKDKRIAIPSPSHRLNDNDTPIFTLQRNVVVSVPPRLVTAGSWLEHAFESIGMIQRVMLEEARSIIPSKNYTFWDSYIMCWLS